jgi:hypothetical protein
MVVLMILVIVVVVCASIAAAVFYGASRWRTQTEELHARLRAALNEPTPRATYDSRELDIVPFPVQRYLRAVLEDGQPIIGIAQFTHRGTFNMGETAPNWRPFSSSQIVTTRPPGFDLDGRVQMVPGLKAFVHDAYVAGEGLLHARLAGLVTVADIQGTPEVAEGELLRYLAETIWYPTALLPGQGVRWTEIDQNSARATLTDAGTTVSLKFLFGPDGLVESIDGDARPRLVDGAVTRTPWRVRVWGYEMRNGVRIPRDGEVAWVLAEGAYPYWRGRIITISYDLCGCHRWALEP